MKRMHVHVSVEDHRQGGRLLFGAVRRKAGRVKDDYAKWMLDDPRVNFAISTRGREPGLDHLGIQVENADELQEVYARLQQGGRRRSSRRARPPAAMPSRRNRGSTIRRAFRGRRSTPPARATHYGDAASRRARRSRMPKPAARRKPVPAESPRRPAARREPWPTRPSTCCSSAPAIRRARSSPKRSSTSSARDNSAPTQRRQPAEGPGQSRTRIALLA